MLQTDLASLSLDNPVLSASGTFGSGWEGRQFSDLGMVGGLVSKTVTKAPWSYKLNILVYWILLNLVWLGVSGYALYWLIGASSCVYADLRAEVDGLRDVLAGALASGEIRGVEDGRLYATGSTTCIVMKLT